MNYKLLSLLVATAWLFCTCCAPQGAPVSAHWTPRTLTVTNISDADLAPGWQIWYNGPISRLERAADSPVKVISNGTLVKIIATEHYTPLAPGASMEITLSNSDYRTKNFNVPEGMFFVTADGKALDMDVAFETIPVPNNGRALYERNSEVAPYPLGELDIVPAPKQIEAGDGESVIARTIRLEYEDAFASEAGFLSEKLTGEFGAEVSDAGETVVKFVSAAVLSGFGQESYGLAIEEGAVTISASHPRGAFYGVQTLLNVLKNKTLPLSLHDVTITDWPDFWVRSQHVDISRNYIPHESVLKLIDLFASYKINMIHWHFSDDEGWRLEIPGLPELTEVGARRGYTPDEGDMLVPAYNGGADPTQGTGSGHLTREQFIEMLRYAHRRHIKVVPEIESPGHARAAITAMRARYNKYIGTDPDKATEFLLEDFDDTSVYNSAQDYGDNTMNVALPSTYRFMEKVVSEIAAMYDETGERLDVVHIGGDEVAHGVWTGSPIAHKFMADNNIPDATALGEYYILKVNEMLRSRGIYMAGWQELVEGRSEALRAAIKDNLAYVNCWSTNGAQAEVAYELANMGFPILLSNVGNFYLDLAASNHPDERGLGWGGYVDDQRSFSMQPWNIYASMWRDNDGARVDNSSAGEGLVQITEEGAKSILGAQGQLWAETIRGFHNTTYMLFPKILGLAERAWNSAPEWNDDAAFLADYSRFNAIATQREMPWLAAQQLTFRLPPPGLYIEGGMLYANSPVAGAEIRYTTDGSTPTLSSTLWTEPVACDATQVDARLFYLGRESVGARFLATE